MGHRGVALIVVLLVAGLIGPPGSGEAAAARFGGLPLARVADLRLPGHTTRFDYLSIDQVARRLYLAHLGDSTLDVIDLDARRVVATVTHVATVHGVAVAPDRRRLYATATGTNELATIDSVTDEVVSRVGTGSFPDGVAYDQPDALVFVSNRDDGTVSVIDALTNAPVTTIKLGDETGNVAYDETGRTVYAAARSPDVLVAIDPVRRRITGRIGLPGCDGAHGVYLDASTQRAFVACERNARLVSVDLRTGRETARSSVGSGPDVLAFDVALRRLYVAAESGVVSVFDTSAMSLRKMGQGHLADGAHSVAVDQATDRVYFPLPDVRGRPVLRVMRPR